MINGELLPEGPEATEGAGDWLDKPVVEEWLEAPWEMIPQAEGPWFDGEPWEEKRDNGATALVPLWLDAEPENEEWPFVEEGQQQLTAVHVQLPDISGGLGKCMAKQDFVALEAFLCEQALWGVFDKKLCLFLGPCWKRLDDQEAEVEIRSIMTAYGYHRFLTSGDYRELRRMLLLNPALQMGQRRELPRDVVNLLDCTLDLATGEYRSHDPEEGFFHFLNMTSAQIVEAPYGDTFERFVDNISNGDPDIRRQLLELVALLITNRQIKAFFVMLGPSHTGKSQFGRFLAELLGHGNVETLRGMDDFSDKWTMGALKGKRLVTCLDLPDCPLPTKAVGAIKQLVGDDGVKGEYKRGALFTFYDKPILVCAGNYPLQIPHAEREEAFLNRLVIIPFYNPMPEADMQQELYKALLAEAPYIVGQALEAWRDLASRNFVLTRTEVPAQYRTVEGNDRLKAVQAFAEECLTQEPDAEVTTSALFAAFRASPMAVDMTSTDFARLFAQAAQGLSADIIAIKRVAGIDQRGYRGLRMRNDPEWQSS